MRKLLVFDKKKKEKRKNYQKCIVCGHKMGVLAGSVDAICKNCGYKDPCCE